MRRRFHDDRVCSCSPTSGMVFIHARMLRDIINREIHPIRCASTCGRKGQKALLLGDLCVEAGYPLWALRLWFFAVGQIHNKDYDDWVNVWFNTKYVQLRDVISDGLCEMIGRRVDDVNRRLKLEAPNGRNSCEYWFGDGWYDSFRYEKYDYYWDEYRDRFISARDGAIAQQQTDRIFCDGQNYHPTQSQDFFYYWSDFDPLAQDLYYEIDDWS